MAKAWINVDESAKQMLSRVLKERPLLHLPPPLHRVPIGVNSILEIVGPSPSAKTEILLQVVVNCILPKNRNGVQYGGLEHSVLFLDLDCRLEIYRLSHLLKLRITEANRPHKTKGSSNQPECDETDVFNECMKRFLYTRCYDSFEFLSALKVLNHKLTDNGVHILMIDNIGAFHSIDRGFSSLPQLNPIRKNIGVQSVFEAVVQEIKKLLEMHSMIVLATKTVTNQVKSSYSTRVSGGLKSVYREYMPLTWQSFVTRRILVRPLDDKRKFVDRVCYSAEWLLPALSVSDEFVVCDTGILDSLRV
ncbi:putative DNA repair protein XRCC2 [Helianthus annuus]|uniref:DNA repair protein XRCC2 n=2 Tax=Helianthus annuus TaxID=4232 RepID=A0A9K3J4P3_HELAN|nr:DNA repair protein XRCC2 homolog [Helianthus annuus]KAF5808693.1 putative DNA repair protein XRCC2 [Helianthus annuus]KAJ0579799.1 putative DNA repair protein XRCC2 [Helianthus annuus]KAJ0595718.1 putative DNA repair protein XRCC2 [Helianthus annuus]KAJ0756367.1 putative DNA repair protein XRCC2 [Helianthus annuus]KAJ0925332.1 putative DNA repair protein XRCC2 [Helianthus annuus]